MRQLTLSEQGSERASEQEQDGSGSFCDLILEVTSHRFCCPLFIRSKPRGPAHTQGAQITQAWWGSLGAPEAPITHDFSFLWVVTRKGSEIHGIPTLITQKLLQKESGISILICNYWLTASKDLKWHPYSPTLHVRALLFREHSITALFTWELLNNLLQMHLNMASWICYCGSDTMCVSCSVEADSLWPHGLWPARLLCPWHSPGKNTGTGCHFLL